MQRWGLINLPRKSPLIEYRRFNRFIEHHGKPLGIATHDCPHDAESFSKCQYGELEVDGPPLADLPPGADKKTSGPDIPDQIPIRALFDGIFRTEYNRIARVLPPVGYGIHFPFPLSRNLPERLNDATGRIEAAA